MPVESSGGEDGAADRFPVGMRVLAVDDDPICLKVLKNLLRKCQYQVMTANQAVVALKMLRENRNKYDLVISDVNMPDMNGFKLLELVGLEMDLPVIMLSSHSDAELVMKGVTHGACDYLLKPVRIEELKVIWQHVIRREKFEPKDQNKVLNQDNDHLRLGEGGQGVTSSGIGDQGEKSNRKRKDYYEDEKDGEGKGPEIDDSSTQKKPRVVWSPDLHEKFVGAVNQLGFDKAVPKKILDLMNVEGLSRENVASHLQKFRLYLKKLRQQVNMVALGGRNSTYMHMGSLDGFGGFHSLTGSGRFSNTSLSSYPPGGVLGRLNSPAGLSLREISSSGLIQPDPQNSTSSLSTIGQLQSAVLPAKQNASLFQGIPTLLGFNQLQESKITTTPVAEFNSAGDPTPFVGRSYDVTRVPSGCSSNSFSSAPSNPLTLLQGNLQQTPNTVGFSNQSSLSAGPSHPSSIDVGTSGSSNFLDQSRYSECCQSVVHPSNFPSNSLPLSKHFSDGQMIPYNLIDGIPSSCPHVHDNPVEMSSNVAVLVPLEDSRGEMQCQRGLIGNVVQDTNFTPKQSWENRGLDYNYGTTNTLLSSSDVMGSTNHSLDQNNSVTCKDINASLISQVHTSSPSIIWHNEVENSAMGTSMRSNEEYLQEQTKAQDSFMQDSLNDLVNSMNKREENGATLLEGEYGWMHTHLDHVYDATRAADLRER